jgi:hypothetical protein
MIEAEVHRLPCGLKKNQHNRLHPCFRASGAQKDKLDEGKSRWIREVLDFIEWAGAIGSIVER